VIVELPETCVWGVVGGHRRGATVRGVGEWQAPGPSLGARQYPVVGAFSWRV